MQNKLRCTFVNLVLLSLIVIMILYYCSGYIIKYATAIETIEDTDSKCDAVHIGIVHIGFDSTIYLYTMLKSLYFYRNNPLHFHIITDDVSMKILETLFKTWEVPQVTKEFYNVNTFSSNQWLMSRYPKLMFPQIVRTSVTNKIIVVDADFTFNGNVYELWNLYSEFEDTQVIGLLENQIEHVEELDNAGLRHFVEKRSNSTVVLYHLEHLKKIEWYTLLTKIANGTEANLTDREIIKTIALKNPDVVHSYNVTYRSIAQLRNNSLLRQLDNSCPAVSENISGISSAVPLPEICLDLNESVNRQWRTLLFFRKFKHNVVENDVTLVSQLTYDRVQILEDLCKRWDGPMSLTFYITDTELHKCKTIIENSVVLRTRFNIAYHVVFKENYHHPLNKCRNIALHNAITPYVFLTDIDLLPMQDLYLNLRKYVGSMEDMRKKALVVPAFEPKRELKNKYPTSKQQVLAMLRRKVLFQFGYNRFPLGHRATNYEVWKTATVPYKINWEFAFEPYIVVERNVTDFDERFVGYGWDKVAHSTTLKAQGYEFIGLPNAFSVHKDHKVASEKALFKSEKYKTCLETLILQVVEENNKKYGSTLDIK